MLWRRGLVRLVHKFDINGAFPFGFEEQGK